jgi:rubrerythrin
MKRRIVVLLCVFCVAAVVGLLYGQSEGKEPTVSEKLAKLEKDYAGLLLRVISLENKVKKLEKKTGISEEEKKAEEERREREAEREAAKTRERESATEQRREAARRAEEAARQAEANRCDTCGGTGVLSRLVKTGAVGFVGTHRKETVRCPACAGSGKRTETIVCLTCAGGKSLVCYKCLGKGKVEGYDSNDRWYSYTCSECKGIGKLLCTGCFGIGRTAK